MNSVLVISSGSILKFYTKYRFFTNTRNRDQFHTHTHILFLLINQVNVKRLKINMENILSLLGDHPIYTIGNCGLQFSAKVLNNISPAEPRQ